MCWTTSTAAPRPAGRRGITSARARGPPVDAATATADRDEPVARGRHHAELAGPGDALASTQHVAEHTPHQRAVVHDEDAGPAVRERWHRCPPTELPPGHPPRRTAPSGPHRRPRLRA